MIPLKLRKSSEEKNGMTRGTTQGTRGTTQVLGVLHRVLGVLHARVVPRGEERHDGFPRMFLGGEALHAT